LREGRWWETTDLTRVVVKEEAEEEAEEEEEKYEGKGKGRSMYSQNSKGKGDKPIVFVTGLLISTITCSSRTDIFIVF
jgi:hypothetical protein